MKSVHVSKQQSRQNRTLIQEYKQDSQEQETRICRLDCSHGFETSEVDTLVPLGAGQLQKQPKRMLDGKVLLLKATEFKGKMPGCMQTSENHK